MWGKRKKEKSRVIWGQFGKEDYFSKKTNQFGDVESGVTSKPEVSNVSLEFEFKRLSR